MRAKYSTRSLENPIVDSSQTNRIKGTVLSTFMLAVVLAAPGCTYSQIGVVDSNLLDPQGKFTLYVDNGSSAISPVDIQVEMDGQTVVHGHFWRGRRNPTPGRRAFKLALEPGMHKLHVVSTRGEAELSREFQVKGELWASISYRYDPDSHYNPTPKHFSFELQDKPIYFAECSDGGALLHELCLRRPDLTWFVGRRGHGKARTTGMPYQHVSISVNLENELTLPVDQTTPLRAGRGWYRNPGYNLTGNVSGICPECGEKT